jgi:hypothetical protein
MWCSSRCCFQWGCWVRVGWVRRLEGGSGSCLTCIFFGSQVHVRTYSESLSVGSHPTTRAWLFSQVTPPYTTSRAGSMDTMASEDVHLDLPATGPVYQKGMLSCPTAVTLYTDLNELVSTRA